MFLETDEFLTELTKMYERQKASGTVWVTQAEQHEASAQARQGGRALAGDHPRSRGDGVGGAGARDGWQEENLTAVPLAKAERFNKSMTLIEAHMDGLGKTVKKSKKARAGGRRRRRVVEGRGRFLNRATKTFLSTLSQSSHVTVRPIRAPGTAHQSGRVEHRPTTEKDAAAFPGRHIL